MPCLVTLAGFFFPRLVMLILLALTGWFGRAFETWYWPLLGFVFMPYTTLAYLISMIYNANELSGGYIVLIVIAVFLDLGMHSDSSAKAVRVERHRTA